MKNLIYITFFFQLFACQKTEIKNDSPKLEKIIEKRKQHSSDKNIKYGCVTTLQNIDVCNLDSKLYGKIKKIEIAKFKFTATPYIFREKIAINRARSLSSDVVDYEQIPKFLGTNTFEKLENLNTSYVLTQNTKIIAVKSFSLLDLKQGTQYLFFANCYVISTENARGNVLVITKAVKKSN